MKNEVLIFGGKGTKSQTFIEVFTQEHFEHFLVSSCLMRRVGCTCSTLYCCNSIQMAFGWGIVIFCTHLEIG